MHAFWGFIIALSLGLDSAKAHGEEIALAPDHPQRYTVVKNDTLWDIAARFLKNPWQWPQIWKANPHIHNPDLIYPGDVLILEYLDGKPHLVLKLEKLKPQIREAPVKQPIPTISYEAVRQFLTTPRVVTKAELEAAPYVVSLVNNRLIGGSGDAIYVRGIKDNKTQAYTLFRQSKALEDPETHEILGYNALYIADAQLTRPGDPATLVITRSVREVLVGDRLLPPAEESFAIDYHPHPPAKDIQGHIIDVLDGVSQIGLHHLVVIDRGTRDGIERGHVLAIWQQGAKVLDPVAKSTSEWVTLPAERSGLVLIFRPFERVSYGIIMQATLPIHLGDKVKRP